ncbi:MAG TPA: MMPL family transporter [Acidimicrobiales bacterium]
MFARLGRWCFRRRWIVIVAWIAVLVVGGGIMSSVGTNSRSEFELPDVESRRGTDILEDAFGGQGAGITGTIVFQADQGVDDPEVRRAMEGLFAEVGEMTVDGQPLRVTSPYSEEGARQISQQGEHAGRIAYADVELPSDINQEDAFELTEDIEAAIPEVEGLQIELGGTIFAEFEEPSSELLGLAFAIVILILAFGSVLAMGLPVGVALAGIGVGTVLAGLVSHLVTMPDFATTLGLMIGLGVGIDYALFIVTRYRENLHAGQDTETATAVAIDTAGRAVLFAGTTVVIALLGLVIMQMSFVTGLAVGAAVVVAVTMVSSLTLLPALLGFAQHRVELTRWRGLIAAGLVAVALVGAGLEIGPLMIGLPLAVVVLLAGFAVAPLRREVERRPPKPRRETVAYRWSRAIQHHPWRAAVVGTAALAVLALPVGGMRLAFSDEGNFPEDTTTRKAYDLLAEGFGPGFNGPLVVASELPEGADPAVAQPVTDALAAAEGVELASPGIPNPDGTAVMWRVIPTTAPQDEETTELVHRLRDEVLPAATEGTGLDPAVTGFVAIAVDFSEYLADRLPWLFAAVLGLSFLLLMAVFRSVLVPLKAVVMNLLSIGAAYGVVVAVFQWGWGGSLLDIAPAPIEPFVPMMLFAIVFGLSMDYEVFLLSRVREEWVRTGDSRTSVADGLAATARVITAAAAIMVFVFGSFLLENDRTIKLFGTGLATAVLLDATVVRMLLVPATMELLGDRNWWLPRWLDRILPRVAVEGPAVAHDAGAGAESGVDAGGERQPEPV